MQNDNYSKNKMEYLLFENRILKNRLFQFRRILGLDNEEEKNPIILSPWEQKFSDFHVRYIGGDSSHNYSKNKNLEDLWRFLALLDKGNCPVANTIYFAEKFVVIEWNKDQVPGMCVKLPLSPGGAVIFETTDEIYVNLADEELLSKLQDEFKTLYFGWSQKENISIMKI